jgi:hypothetical protein
MVVSKEIISPLVKSGGLVDKAEKSQPRGGKKGKRDGKLEERLLK